ncbi:glycosyltransferase family 39 protein [bacterium]|nr:glycosyltransferase family 39 protein [bacterium]
MPVTQDPVALSAENSRLPGWVLPATVLLLAAALRLGGLTRESVYLDEAKSIDYAVQGVRYTIEGRSQTNHPPLYEILLGGWVRLAGSGEAAVRLPSVLCGVLACYLLYVLGKDILSREAGLLAALFLGLGYYPLRYSQEARNYSLLLALSAASAVATWRAIHRRRTRDWVVLGAVNAALGWTHLFGWLVMLAEGLFFLIVWVRERRDFGRWLAVQAATALLFLPWVGVVLDQAQHGGRRGPLPAPEFETVWELLTWFLPLNHRQSGYGILSAVYYVAIAAALIWLLTRRGPQTERKGRRRAGLFLALWLVTPFAVVIVVSGLFYSCFLPRCLIVAAPPASLLLAAAVAALPRRAQLVATVIVCGLAVVGLRKYYKTPEKDQWREIVAHIEAERREGDCVLVVNDRCLTPFEYYCRLPQEELPRRGASRHLSVEELAEAVPPLVKGRRRLWLVIAYEHSSPIRSYMNGVSWATRVGKLPKAMNITGYVYDLESAP